MSSRAAARALWRAKWRVLRVVLSVFLLWVVLADSPARVARAGLEALPDLDAVAAADRLQAQGRFGESIALADAGLALATDPDQRLALERLREKAARAQESWLRRVRDAGLGALTGPGGGEGIVEGSDDYTTLERLAGALVADFFVLGDVRDLVLQSIRGVQGKEVDPLIVALSAIGVLTTAAPEGDWIPSLLKSARKLGTLTRRLSDALIALARERDLEGLRSFARDVRTLVRAGSPAGAARLLRLAEEPAEVSRLARFIEGPASEGAAAAQRRALRACALDWSGRPGARLLLNSAEGSIEAARAESLLLRAGRKGPLFERWLERSPQAARALLRPHPLVGLLKGLRKGTVAAVAQRVIDGLSELLFRHGWLVGVIGGWCVLEVGLLARHAWSCRSASTHAPSGSRT